MPTAESVINSGPLFMAVPVAIAAGVISFLSPCVLPLIPGYLSYVTGMVGSERQEGRRVAKERRSRALLGAIFFTAGFSAVFVSFGAAFGFAGNTLLEHQAAITRTLGVLTILMGLAFLGVFERFVWTGKTIRPAWKPKMGLAGAPVLGFMFGLSWTPCIGPTLASVLGLSMSSGTAWRGAALALAYSFGIGVPFILASFTFEKAMKVLAVARKHTLLITRIGAGMLIVIGVMQVTGLWGYAMSELRSWVSGYTPAL
ncbi:cytochrome c biogenesis CcdA family protein [Streptomyces sp. NPDC091027]|uniref:cytochrome c biogenesis CcdA family protein n=1 Tax=Streptomyces sp. NPDC091027 TaxID=3365971 RepID=UPI00382FBE29